MFAFLLLAVSFTDELWLASKPIYSQTLEHPFVKGLSDGTLPRENFLFYLDQDVAYLHVFGDALNRRFEQKDRAALRQFGRLRAPGVDRFGEHGFAGLAQFACDKALCRAIHSHIRFIDRKQIRCLQNGMLAKRGDNRIQVLALFNIPMRDAQEVADLWASVWCWKDLWCCE